MSKSMIIFNPGPKASKCAANIYVYVAWQSEVFVKGFTVPVMSDHTRQETNGEILKIP